MKLAQSISEADAHQLKDLAAFLVAELQMQSLDVTTGEMMDVEPEDLSKAMAAWAFMQTNTKDADL